MSSPSGAIARPGVPKRAARLAWGGEGLESITRLLPQAVLYLCRPFHDFLMDAYPALNRCAIYSRPLRGI
jgi:hypothetical protein